MQMVTAGKTALYKQGEIMTERKRNSLTDPHKFALRDWMIKQQQAGTVYESLITLTAAAQGEHGFLITLENMRGIQESTGIYLLKRKRKVTIAYKDLAEKVRDFDARISSIELTLQAFLDLTAKDFTLRKTDNQPQFCREVR